MVVSCSRIIYAFVLLLNVCKAMPYMRKYLWRIHTVVFSDRPCSCSGLVDGWDSCWIPFWFPPTLKNISSYKLWHCKCYRHKNRDLREINRDMHRMFAFTDLCIIWSYWCIINANEHFALLNKSAHIHKYLLFNQFIKYTPSLQCVVYETSV